MMLFRFRRLSLILLTVVFASLNISMVLPHNIHSSMVQLKLDSKAKTVLITANLFANDLEQGVAKMNNKEVDINDPNLKTYLLNYFKSKFQLKQNNRTVDFKLIDFEMQEDIMVLRLSASNISTLKNVTVANTLLMEIFDDQKNMVSILEKETKQTLFFDSTTTTQKITFK
jgi:hypothetical protein